MKTFDEILALVGDCGPYQLLVLAAMCLALSFAAFQVVSVVFTAAHVDFWCADADQQLLNSTPRLLNNCSGACSSWNFSTVGVFESTWRSQFGLVCGRDNLVDVSSSVFMLGLLLGSTAYGVVSDRFGRSRAAACAVLHTWLCAMSQALSPSLQAYMLLRCLTGVGVSGITSVCHATTAEAVTSRRRMLWVQAGATGWSAAFCLLAGLAFFVRTHWRLELAISAPAVAAVPAILLLGESPRWLLAKNRPQEAASACRFVARVNGRTPPATLESDVASACADIAQGHGHRRQVTILDLLRSDTMRRPTLLVWNNYFCSSLMYYGLLLSTGRLAGSIFLNFLLVSGACVPASIFAVAAVRILGRPLFFLLAYSVASACLLVIACLWGSRHFDAVVVALAVVGIFFASASLSTNWAYASELFPTLVRNAGMGSSSTVARFAGLLAPLVNLLGQLWPPLPFFVFGGFSGVNCFLVLLLPETRGVRLPESLQDADEEYVTPKITQLMDARSAGRKF